MLSSDTGIIKMLIKTLMQPTNKINQMHSLYFLNLIFIFINLVLCKINNLITNKSSTTLVKGKNYINNFHISEKNYL